MTNVGDHVTVTISNAVLSGTVDIRKDTSMAVRGEIVQDLGDSWLIRLDIAVDGKDKMVVSKTAQVTSTQSTCDLKDIADGVSP